MQPVDLLQEMIPEHKLIKASPTLFYIRIGHSYSGGPFVWIYVQETEVYVLGETKRLEDPRFVPWFQKITAKAIKECLTERLFQ